MNPTLEAKLKNIPPGPGVYLYKDDSGETIYVGKAKSLRNRVRTYFQLSADFDVRKDQMAAVAKQLVARESQGIHAESYWAERAGGRAEPCVSRRSPPRRS